MAERGEGGRHWEAETVCQAPPLRRMAPRLANRPQKAHHWPTIDAPTTKSLTCRGSLFHDTSRGVAVGVTHRLLGPPCEDAIHTPLSLGRITGAHIDAAARAKASCSLSIG